MRVALRLAFPLPLVLRALTTSASKLTPAESQVDVVAVRRVIDIPDDVLRVKLDEATERSGAKVTTVEIRGIGPTRESQEAIVWRSRSAEVCG